MTPRTWLGVSEDAVDGTLLKGTLWSVDGMDCWSMLKGG